LSDLLSPPAYTAGPVEDARWALVQRVASSRQLGKASQLREILLYVSRRALMENASSISEQEIGCKVLGRRPDFNPNEDNIVRAQMRHLRQKLEEYFNFEGADEPLILTIPKGGYLPHFEARPTPATPQVAPKTGTSKRMTILLWAALAGLVIFGAVLWRRQAAAVRGPVAAEAAALRSDPIWPRIFPAGRETSIVVADTCMVMLQDILDVDVSLSEYLNGGYPEKLIAPVADPKLHAALKLIAARQYTSLGDATIAARLMEVSHHYTAHTDIRYSRDVNVREFKTGNFILIGSRRGMPWVQLFEPQLNFNLEEDRQTRQFHFGNRAPAPGEKASYCLSKAQGAGRETYADIALLPNLAGTGYVLMLSGIDMAATEAAGELVARTDFPATLARLLNSRPGQPPATAIEILLRAKAVGAATNDYKIVAFRLPK
jgi:LPXTG-motif cell wall-anchored protein